MDICIEKKSIETQYAEKNFEKVLNPTASELDELAFTEREQEFAEWVVAHWITAENLQYKHSFNDSLANVLNNPAEENDDENSLGNRKKFCKKMMEMNDNYAFITKNSMIVDFRLNDTITTNDFKNYLMNVPYNKNQTWYDVWFKSPHRRGYASTFFEPNTGHNEEKRLFNTWSGWAIKPRIYKDLNEYKADFKKLVQPWLNHIEHILCSDDIECYKYYIKWLAWMVQRTNQKPGVGVILYSSQEGAGKGLMNELIKQFFGSKHAQLISDCKHLLGSFNGHLANKIFVFLDEAVWGGDKAAQGKMLSLITEKTMTIEDKRVRAEEVNSYHYYHISSNNSYAQHLSSTDRRWFMPNVSNKISPLTAEGMAYFETLGNLVEDPEQKSAKAVLRFLLDVDLTNFKIRDIPKSSAKDRLVVESCNQSDPLRAFLLECYKRRFETEYAIKPGARLSSKTVEANFDYFLSTKPFFKNQRQTADILRFLPNIASKCRTSTERGWEFWQEPEFKNALTKLLGVSADYLDEFDD